MIFSIVPLLPVSVISTENSFEANEAPLTISNGALSPPKASITTLILKISYILLVSNQLSERSANAL